MKPDYGVTGGFERLLERIVGLLVEDGHQVEEQALPALLWPRAVWGNSTAAKVWREYPGFFTYAALVEDVRRLDLSRYDLVLSTQPPTFLADHPRVLALFYHQARVFYDLSERYGRMGEIPPRLHQIAGQEVQAIDRAFVGNVKHWLAGSSECSSRLAEYWSIPASRTSLLHAPALTEVPEDPPAWSPHGPIVCVSRHEWPKRTELLVATGHLLAGRPGRGRTIEFIGTGGRLDFVRGLDERIVADPSLAADPNPERFWMQAVRDQKTRRTQPEGSPNRFLGNVSDDERNRAYAAASVVVAPAFREDYGLTALEAMLWQRPVIVCRDGGGLVDLVEETGAGLVVDPTPKALADGIEQILGDDQLRAGILERARDVPHSFTWARAAAQLRHGIAATAV
ncbi:MAG: glycosyltransferase family 4 protein [Actinomycetota bacterium]|nr:glycosyltransferase family 4 protein [Actinomycetota bacterium]